MGRLANSPVFIGKELVPDKARFRADYDLALREITRQLSY